MPWLQRAIAHIITNLFFFFFFLVLHFLSHFLHIILFAEFLFIKCIIWDVNKRNVKQRTLYCCCLVLQLTVKTLMFFESVKVRRIKSYPLYNKWNTKVISKVTGRKPLVQAVNEWNKRVKKKNFRLLHFDFFYLFKLHHLLDILLNIEHMYGVWLTSENRIEHIRIKKKKNVGPKQIACKPV